MLVFIDESGDPGFKLTRGSTDVFVAELVAFEDAGASQATQAAIEALADRLRIRREFKFNKSRHQVRDAFFDAVRHCDFRVRSIVVQPVRRPGCGVVACSTGAGVGDDGDDQSYDSGLAADRSGARKTCRQVAPESSIERGPD